MVYGHWDNVRSIQLCVCPNRCRNDWLFFNIQFIINFLIEPHQPDILVVQVKIVAIDPIVYWLPCRLCPRRWQTLHHHSSGYYLGGGEKFWQHKIHWLLNIQYFTSSPIMRCLDDGQFIGSLSTVSCISWLIVWS